MADEYRRMRQLTGTPAEWAASSLVIGDAEIAVERLGNRSKIKLGNGTSVFAQLPYLDVGDSGAGNIAPNTLPKSNGNGSFVNSLVVDDGTTVVTNGDAIINGDLVVDSTSTFTGLVTANNLVSTTKPLGTDNTSVATTAFVHDAVDGLLSDAALTFVAKAGDTMSGPLAISAGGLLVNGNSQFINTVEGPTAAPGTSNQQLATTAFVQEAMGGGGDVYVKRAGDTMVGPLVINHALGLESTSVSCISFVVTGLGTAPTAPPGTDDESLATTAFVMAAVAAGGGGGGVPEAPIDGRLYGRKDAFWTEILGDAGGGPYVIRAGDTMTGKLAITNTSGDLLSLTTTAVRGSGNNTIRFRDPTGNKGHIGFAFSNDDMFVINQLAGRNLVLGTGNLQTFVIEGTNHYVGIGTLTPTSRLTVNDGFISVNRFANPSMVSLRTAGGLNGAPAITGANVTVGYVGASGFDGTVYREVASIGMSTVSATSGTSAEGRMVFNTVPSGSLVPVERMRISGNGIVSVGTTSTDPLGRSIPAGLRVGPGSPNSYTSLEINAGAGAGAYPLLCMGTNGSQHFELATGPTVGGVTFSALGATSNIIFLNNGGQNRLQITPEGNVGIGTNSPNEKLEVAGGIYASGGVFVDQELSVTGEAFVGRLAVDDSATVGGTLTVASTAEITGMLTTRSGITLSNDASVYGVAATVDAPRGSGFRGILSNEEYAYQGVNLPHYGIQYAVTNESGGNIVGTFSAYYGLRFNSLGVERMRINQLGNVGIGTITPSVKLDISGDAPSITARVRNNSVGLSNYAELLLETSNSFNGIGRASIKGASANDGNSDTVMIFATTSGTNPVATEKMRLDQFGNLGIGISQPVRPLHVAGTIMSNSATSAGIEFSTPAAFWSIYTPNAGNALIFKDLQFATEVGRFESGAFHVGAVGNVPGGSRTLAINAGDAATAALNFNILGVNKTNLFWHTPTNICYLDTPYFVIRTVDGAERYHFSSIGILPVPDNALVMGNGTNRWNSVWAANGAIQTSDAREKDWLGPLTTEELAAAKSIAKGIGKYRWLDIATSDKLHIGVTAQNVIEAMEAQGLDALEYGLVVFTEWEAVEEVPATPPTEEVRDEDGNIITPANPGFSGRPGREAGDRYSVRYDELNMFIHAAQEQRLAALEEALEGG